MYLVIQWLWNNIKKNVTEIERKYVDSLLMTQNMEELRTLVKVMANVHRLLYQHAQYNKRC